MARSGIRRSGRIDLSTVNAGGADDIGLPQRDAGERIRQERTAHVSGAGPERPHVGNIHPRGAFIRRANCVARRKVEEPRHLPVCVTAELAVGVIQFEADDDVAPLRIVAEEFRRSLRHGSTPYP